MADKAPNISTTSAEQIPPPPPNNNITPPANNRAGVEGNNNRAGTGANGNGNNKGNNPNGNNPNGNNPNGNNPNGNNANGNNANSNNANGNNANGNNANDNNANGNNANGNNANGNNANGNNANGNNANGNNNNKGSNANGNNANGNNNGKENNSDEEEKPFFAYTQAGAWGGPTSTFGSLAFLSVFPITGLLGIDHFYLRSPSSGLFKLIMNILTLGMWYLYDAAQILSERDLVEKFGYSYPIVGPTGLGAGILAKGETEESEAEEPIGPSPWRFIALCIFALLPIPFGLEYFAVGDTWGGITKVLSNFSWTFGVLQFFSLVSGLYLIYRVFFKTESMMFEDGIPRTFPWSIIMSDYCPAGTVSPEAGCSGMEGESSGILDFIKGWGASLKGVKAKLGGPLASLTEAAGTVAGTAKEVVSVAKTYAETVIPPAAAAAAQASALVAQAPTLESGITGTAKNAFTNPNTLKNLYKQQGGAKPTVVQKGTTFFQDFALIAALGVTIATGVYLAKLPSWRDVDVSFILPFSVKLKSASGGQDDTPPQPTAV